MKLFLLFVLLVVAVHAASPDRLCNFVDLYSKPTSWSSQVHEFKDHIVAFYSGWNYYDRYPFVVATSSLERGHNGYAVHYAYNLDELLLLIEEYAPPQFITLRYSPNGLYTYMRRINRADVEEIKRLITTENFVFNGMTIDESLAHLDEYAKNRLYCQ